MVQIGTIEYEARVTGVAEAKQNAEEFAATQEDAAEASERAAASGGFLAGTLGLVASREEEAGDEADNAGTKTDLLSSSLFFLGSTAVTTAAQMLGVSGALGTVAGAAGTVKATLSGLTLSGVVGSVTSAFSGFVGWLAAGSAGALAFAGAIGAGIGALGVWVLQVTGALDAVRGFGRYVGSELPPSVRDGLLAVTGIFTGSLATIGAFITGTIAGGFDEGFARAMRVSQTFRGAYNRTMGRVEDFTDRTVAYVISRFDQLGDAVVGTVTQAWNSNIPARISFPAATIAGQTIGGGGISIPRLQTGGMVDETGLAVVHEGESVIPEPITSAAEGGGGGGGGDSTVIERIVVNVSGDFDPSDMSKRDVESLADRIDAAIGKNTNTRAGVR
jgi:hypothetical protein